MLAYVTALTTIKNNVGNGVAMALATIHSGGSVESPQEVQSYQDRGLLAAMTEDLPLYFPSFMSLSYHRCCIVVVVSSLFFRWCCWSAGGFFLL